ncbi:MAG: cbb3-type cytochrome c oxidase subunit I, partial [Pseudomonadota bacterium]
MDAFKIGALGLIALIAAYAADQGNDLAFRIHGLLVMIIAGGLAVWSIKRVGDPRPVRSSDDYNDDVVRAGVIATAFWGVAGLAVGVIIALQLTFPVLNIEWAQPFANFGRLRPLHTSAVIFAFGGNALIASSIYIVQRTSRTRLFGG